MIKRICVILMLLGCMQITAFAEGSPCIFFSPQSMNEANEIVVPIYTKNLPHDNDGLCGCEFQFAYNTEQFTLKTDESGRPILGTNETMLVQNTDIVETSVSGDTVSVSYVDFSGENNLVLRDGPLFYFTLIPKSPDALWNSDDYYPLRFLAGSVNLITLDKDNFSLSGTSAEGIDTYVGGYNSFPDFELPGNEDTIEFKSRISAVYINGEANETDAVPYIKDEFMIPLRPLAEAIGMDISWDGDNQTVSLFYPYISAYFDMKAGDIYINAKQRTDLNKAEIINDRTFVPFSTVQAVFGNSINIVNNGDSVSLEFNNNKVVSSVFLYHYENLINHAVCSVYLCKMTITSPYFSL
ncbi:MAG: stalk domain-containing protein [Clostridia bacterium]|nr:stalk domain-containing protein [Clostridia bacterium]